MAETIEYMEQLGGTPAPFQMHSDALILVQRQLDVAVSQAIEEEMSVGDLSYQMTDLRLHDLFSETVQDTIRPTDVEAEETWKRVHAGRG